MSSMDPMVLVVLVQCAAKFKRGVLGVSRYSIIICLFLPEEAAAAIDGGIIGLPITAFNRSSLC